MRLMIARNISFAENQQADGHAHLVKPDAGRKPQICDKATNATSAKLAVVFSKHHVEPSRSKYGRSAITIGYRVIRKHLLPNSNERLCHGLNWHD
jgi:hypothetical protein